MSEVRKRPSWKHSLRGSFYASTGVALPQLVISQEAICLEIEQDWDYLYTTTFIHWARGRHPC